MFSRHYDLFAGIGGFSLALPNIPHEFCEIDKFCQGVLRKAFPSSTVHGDIASLDLIEDREAIITGGFPCQPFSVAGAGMRLNKGFIREEDIRSNLFFEAARLIAKVNPKVVLLENVPGILSIKNKEGRVMGEVVEECLAQLGYSVFVEIISPTDLGIPHVRNRVFFIGVRENSDVSFTPFKKPTINKTFCVRDILQPVESISEHLFISHKWKNLFLKKDPSTSREQALKNSALLRKPVESVGGRAQLIAEILDDTPSGISRQSDRAYSIEGCSPTLVCSARPFFNTEPDWRQLSVVEGLRLQSFPDNHPVSEKDSTAYKQIGNSVNVEVIRNIISRIWEI
jgi:DNA (cytosine-5)-methyltransferase 1